MRRPFPTDEASSVKLEAALVSGRCTAMVASGLALVAVVACVGSGGWDVGGLEARHPELRAYRGQRLADALPYFAPDAEGVVLFLCRWSTRAPVDVGLAEGSSSAERELVTKALRAWEGAGLGIRFRPVEAARAQLAIEFIDEDPPGSIRGRSGGTIADCAISDDLAGFRGRDPIPANLARASIQIRRATRNLLAELAPLSEEELLGGLIHELGHALGYPSHVRLGSSVMTANVDQVRRIGRRVLAGDEFHDATLAALYALPSGVVVGSLDAAAALDPRARQLVAIAGARGWPGPFVRVGDESARLFWRPETGRVDLAVRNWAHALRDPFELRWTPNGRAHEFLVGVASDGR